MSTKSDIASKITLVRRMLAKAELTTPAEALALTEAAEKIMLRLGIDEAMVTADTDEPVQPNTRTEVAFTGSYRMADLMLTYTAIKALSTVYCLRLSGRKVETLAIYGRQGQVERAEMLARSLQIQGNIAMKDWWKHHKQDFLYHTEHEKFMARRAFLISFGQGANDRITEEKKVAEQDTPGSALVLANEADQAERYAREQVGRVGKSRGLHSGSARARQAGYEQGRRANVGTTQVGGQRRHITA